MAWSSKLQKTCTQLGQKNCNSIPNQAIQTSTLIIKEGLIVAEVNAQPNQRYQLEFFANTRAGSQEAEKYLGSKMVITNARGTAEASLKPITGISTVTATLTNHLGATSELSAAIVVP